MANPSIKTIVLTFGIIAAVACNAAAAVKVSENNDIVTIENSLIKVQYDLSTGTYNAVDLRDGAVCIKNAFSQLNDLTSNNPDFKHSYKTKSVKDALGRGKKLIIESTAPKLPSLLLEIYLYDKQGFIALAGGIENNTDSAIQLKRIQPTKATAFQAFDLSENFSMMNGNGGAEESFVTHGRSISSRNNIMATFGKPGSNRTLVLGGLTYHDYEKFAEAGSSRLAEITNGPGKLLYYLDLGVNTSDGGRTSPSLRLLKGTSYKFAKVTGTSDPAFATVAFDDNEIVLKASGLNSKKKYHLGFSWWDDRKGRVTSVSIDTGQGTKKHLLVDKQSPPSGSDGQPPEERRLNLPEKAHSYGQMRIVFTNDAGPNVCVSEIWLSEGIAPAESLRKSVSDSENRTPPTLDVKLYALDPVGKKVDPGVRYLPKDRFYVDFMTDNPFEALEKYGLNIRAAQNIKVNIYDFPTVCLWYAHHGGYGGGGAYNNTPGAVAEIDRINKLGFNNYSRIAIRLVPDSYTTNNQQGWWDDERFRMYGSTNLGPFKGGQYAKPYETSKKWGKAMTKRGAIPLTYFQTAFRSEDYAEKFPQHMLFNKTRAWKAENLIRPDDDEKFWGSAWARSGRIWGYDYTDPDFLKHMREVYANLRSGGVKGLMFDYPSSGWASGGGMEDPYSTTAMAYRTIFQLPYDGLGPDCYIHERNIQRGSDITLGLVASQRIWGDTDRITPKMVTRGGLRWYKNRVVVSYDMDAKNIARPESRDEVRGLLTMAYVTSGRLLLATSFGQMSKETFLDLTRIYPFHTTTRSARPVDAFTTKYPTIYDFPIDAQWHQLTFYNPEREKETTIGVDLAGDTAFGALGLDPAKDYYVYDFWNNKLVGKLKGSQRLEQTLRPHESRMMSIHEAKDQPQFISTDRHIMQGYVDIEETKWNAGKKQLSGTSKIVGAEPYKVIIATNGYKPTKATARSAKCQVRMLPGKDQLAELQIDRDKNGTAKWTVTFTGNR